MTLLAFMSLDVLWRNALVAIPLAVIVAAICRWLPCRPSTRHALWVLLLISLLAPPKLPRVDWDAAWDRVTTQTAAITSMIPTTSDDDVTRQLEAVTPVMSGSAVRSAESAPVFERHSQPAVALRTSISSAVNLIQRPAALPRSTAASAQQLTTTSPMTRNAEAVQPLSVADDCEEVTECPLVVELTAQACESASESVMERTAYVVPVRTNDSLFAKALRDDPRPEAVLFSDMESSLSSAANRPGIFATLAEQMATMWRETALVFAQRAWDSSKQWAAQIGDVGRAVANVQPIPAVVWIGGCVVIVAVMIGRIVRFQRLLKTAQPASVQLRRAVAEAAASIGLRCAPRTLVIAERVSPLVWCGRERILLIPQPLWDDLDELGRSAVILHELAHIKRRDHWVCWIEMMVAAVYWWHPLVWVIRHRLRDEADRCCDAWVTSLLPATAQRGAYARALLATRRFLGNSRLDTPAMGLGVTSAQARQFARRLTMVMTERSNPGMSAMGAALTVCVAAAALLSAPLFACPPEEQPVAAKSPRPSMNRAPRAVNAMPAMPSMPTPPAPPAPPAPPMGMGEDASTFERHMMDRSRSNPFAPGAMGDDGDLRMRLEMLEQRLDRLSGHLEQLLGTPRSSGQSGGHSGAWAPTPGPAPAPGAAQGMGGGRAFVAPRVMVAPSQDGQWRTQNQAPMAWSGGMGSTMPRVQGSVARAGADEGESVSQFYALPEGKLEALTELMSRSDVPLLVTPKDDGIEVHGTPRQQEIFAAFVSLINPEGQRPAGASMLMQRELEAARAMARDRGDQARSASRKAIVDHKRAIEIQRSRLRQQSQELYRRAREVEGRADAMHDQADDKQGHEQTALLAQADSLFAEARALESEAEALEDAADQMDDELEALLEQSDEMEGEIDQAIEQALAVLELETAALAQADADAAEAAAELEAEVAEAAAEAAEAAEAEAEADEDDGDDC